MTKINVKKNILFDLDGTIADPFEAFQSSLNDAFVKAGRAPLAASEIRKCIGPPLHKSLVEILGLAKEEVDPIMKDYRAHHELNFRQGYEVYSGIFETIRELARDYRIFLATSKPIFFARPLIENFGLAKYFTGIHGSELDGRNSDKGELIAWILKQESLIPEESIMVGDRMFDIIGAQKNSVSSIGVLWGFGDRAELELAKADYIVEAPEEIKQHL